MRIASYEDFTAALHEAGFSTGGANSEGVFSLAGFFAENIKSHTGDPETDPWEWRMRVLDERLGIAYAKVFFNKSGFITKEWYPFFLACRRKNRTLDEEYADGLINVFAKRIYDVINENGPLPFHIVKQLTGFPKEDASKFERALTELQMKMYITMCGRQQKVSLNGSEYGWSSTVFCTTESFFGDDVFEAANGISEREAAEKITERICFLNPSAEAKKIPKFIFAKQ